MNFRRSFYARKIFQWQPKFFLNQKISKESTKFLVRKNLTKIFENISVFCPQTKMQKYVMYFIPYNGQKTPIFEDFWKFKIHFPPVKWFLSPKNYFVIYKYTKEHPKNFYDQRPNIFENIHIRSPPPDIPWFWGGGDVLSCR